MMEVVLSGLIDFLGGKVLEVVDGLLDAFHALLHAFVRFFLELFILAFEYLTAISQLLGQCLILSPELLYLRGELLVEELQFLPSVLLAVYLFLLLVQAVLQLLVLRLRPLDGLRQLGALLGDLCAFGLRLLEHLLESR